MKSATDSNKTFGSPICKNLRVPFERVPQSCPSRKHAQVAGVSIATLMGTVGGNLGMFVGMSMMTMIEWLEVRQRHRHSHASILKWLEVHQLHEDMLTHR